MAPATPGGGRRPARRHAVPSGGAAGITVRGDLGSTSTFRPDVLLSLSGRAPSARTLLPVDAKYKRCDRYGLGAGDVHQLLTYDAGYTPSADARAVIVHPCSGGHSHRTLQASGPRGALGSIHVLGVDTHASPQQAAVWVRSPLPWADW